MNSVQANLFDSVPSTEFETLTGTTVGVDEVGRGPLIGDVVACAVILPKDCKLPLRDSKKLSEKRRQILSEQIKEQAIGYFIALATPEEIDELNILHATMLAMQRSVEGLTREGHKIDQVYVDGNRCPNIAHSCQSVVKGDDKIMEISAASILAKVFRDQQMLDLHEKYPQYGFNKHKGYPTAKHLQALKEFGMIPGYRKSFKPVRELYEQ